MSLIFGTRDTKVLLFQPYCDGYFIIFTCGSIEQLNINYYI